MILNVSSTERDKHGKINICICIRDINVTISVTHGTQQKQTQPQKHTADNNVVWLCYMKLSYRETKMIRLCVIKR